jgi:hypothetical protein
MEADADLCGPTPSEQLRSLILQTIDDIKGTSITPTSKMIDALLDLHNLATTWEKGYKEALRILSSSCLTVAYYKSIFGTLEIPEDWTPIPQEVGQ